MGSRVLDHRPSEGFHSSLSIMLGGAVAPSESGFRPASHPPSHLESGSSRSTPSSNTTPTSSAAPPSTSAVGSAHLAAHPPQDVPPYINRPTPSHSHSSSRSASVTPGSSHLHHPPTSMRASHPTAHGPSVDYTTRPAVDNSAPTPTEPSRPASHSSPASPRLRPTFRSLRSLGGSEASSPSRIKVRDLSHIQSLASEEFLAPRQGDRWSGAWAPDRQYEISSMPVTDIIEMVAGLLTKITTTNDAHHEQVHRHIPPADGASSLSPQATSVLAFHGKNVPSISILSYLTRIHKYCPTTYEVFLSMLVYFDRMTELVKGQVDCLRRRAAPIQTDSSAPSGGSSAQTSPIVTPPPSATMAAQDPSTPSCISPSLHPQDGEDPLSHFFVVDSFNIHRLVIAGVTCASKFFSDVFYTNSRYAKVTPLSRPQFVFPN